MAMEPVNDWLWPVCMGLSRREHCCAKTHIFLYRHMCMLHATCMSMYVCLCTRCMLQVIWSIRAQMLVMALKEVHTVRL